MVNKQILCDIPLNRVEGDLEIKVAATDGVVTDAWSSGTMFRGFERLLVGRGALDGLVITPRICGICSLTHLTAAVKALDQAAGVAPPPNAVRLRNIALMSETIQSDVRQSLLMYLVDFVNPAHAHRTWHPEAVARYAPFQGHRALAAVRETKRLLEIIALIGGQWPHTSFMVPGGVVYAPATTDLRKCRQILRHFRQWYETTVLGCPASRWLAVDSAAALTAWLEEPAHADSDVGFLLRAGRELGLDRLGRGHDRYLSCGSLESPAGSAIQAVGHQLVAAGFCDSQVVKPFDQGQVREHVAWSWYADQPGGLHPFDGITDPIPSGEEGHKYSWSKAPRYAGLAAETGPLAERMVAGDPLFRDLTGEQGASALTRQLARMTRPVHLFHALDIWLEEVIRTPHEPVYINPGPLQNGHGVGLVEAARGALGHWMRIVDGRIAHYQIITPTAWNGSPRDDQGVRGAWEESLLGTPIPDLDNPVLVGHVVRSFDPCLVCSVHVVGGRRVRLMV